MNSLVSVLMPSYNAAATIPTALASLFAQSYGDWECIVVDDGSSDGTRDLVLATKDSRVRYLRLERNRGRGGARQVALDNAKGDLIAFLDADDWYYPWKLEQQNAILRDHPELAVLSTGEVVVERNELRRVRLSGASAGSVKPRKWARPSPLPFSFPPTLMQASLAKEYRFDPSLRLAEDFDYMMNLVLGKWYAVVPEVLYAYSEYDSVTLEKVRASLTLNRQTVRTFRDRFPLSSRTRCLEAIAKSGLYAVAHHLGLWDRVRCRQTRKPTAEEQRHFLEARSIVESWVQKVWG